MQNISRRPFSTTIKGVYTLTRFLPTISWGISASIIGLAFALPGTDLSRVNWVDYLLVLANVILFHGVASHAINDLEDWQSGTDRMSPGIYSGGSKVIRNNLLSREQLIKTALISLTLGHVITAYLTLMHGLIILAFLMIALWSSIAYTQPPLRLSYKPLLGEWLAGFPAIVAVTYLSFYILKGNLTLAVVLAGITHGILSIGLLMFHHIADFSSDLLASPPKITTVAYVARKYGAKRCGLVAAFYFALIIPIGLISALYYPILLISVLFAVPCIILSMRVSPASIPDITVKETYIFALVISHALAYLLVLASL